MRRDVPAAPCCPRCHGQAVLGRSWDQRHAIWWCAYCRRQLGTTRIASAALPAAQYWSLPRCAEVQPVEPEPCPVCGRLAVLEGHDTAPRVVFGDEAARWPVVWCCRACHERWHERTGVAGLSGCGRP